VGRSHLPSDPLSGWAPVTPDPPTDTGAPVLTLTGERTLPGIWHENYWLRRHQVAYDAFAPLCAQRRVLDAGCGEGYGAARLSVAGARLVVGIDLDLPTLRHARATYPEVAGVRANLVLLPCAGASLDVVVSAQTIEHLWDQDRFMSECARVLRPGGVLAMSTPNRRTFPPGNLFHSRELDAAELVHLVRPHLEVVRVLGVAHGPRLRDWAQRHGDVVAASLASPPDVWTDDLAALVRSVSVDDFTVTDNLDGSLDLIVIARRETRMGKPITAK
jgi:SAM-dependent methyltransferase